MWGNRWLALTTTIGLESVGLIKVWALLHSTSGLLKRKKLGKGFHLVQVFSMRRDLQAVTQEPIYAAAFGNFVFSGGYICVSLWARRESAPFRVPADVRDRHMFPLKAASLLYAHTVDQFKAPTQS